MKVAVVGCGAVGSYYGAKLSLAGHEVHFLLRSEFEHVRCNGVVIQDVEGDLHANPICASRPEEIGPSDLVIIALKTTANRHLSNLLPPMLGPTSAVLTLQNGLGSVEQLGRLAPASQILGGLCFVCLNRVAPGVIRHFDRGFIVMGESVGPRTSRTVMIADLLNRAGIDCRLTDNLQRTQWEKLVWNIPFNGLGVAAVAGFEAAITGTFDNRRPLGKCLPTDALLSDGKWEKLIRELMLEIIRSAQARGLALSEVLADKQILRTKGMGSYRASTLLDFEQGQPLELDSIFLEPLRQARAAGVSVPRLEALCSVLQILSEGR